jgi:ABC-2 type transport system permease protein
MGIKPYWALFRARARLLLQYRAAALAGLCTQWVFGFVMISALTAFYQSGGADQPMTLQQAVTYTWMGQAMLGMLPWNIDRETGDSVRSGAVAYDLTRPIDLYGHWFARALALRTAPTLLKSIPMFLIATFLMPAGLSMVWPSPAALLAWLAAVLGALLLSASITVLMQTTMFWTVTGDGVTRIMPHFVTLLSGMIIPLPLMPDALQALLRMQPFAGLGSPALLFAGTLPPEAVWGVLALQGLWGFAFIALGRWVMGRGLSRLTIAGG